MRQDLGRGKKNTIFYYLSCQGLRMTEERPPDSNNMQTQGTFILQK